jgi:phage host-nuclease inhibitor protein Gam
MTDEAAPQPDEPDEDEYAEVMAPPIVGDLTQAERWLRQLTRMRRDIEAYEAHATEQHRRIDAWRVRRVGIIEREVAYVEEGLQAFMRAYAGRTRTKTLALIHGVMRLRTPRKSLAVSTPAEVVSWLRENGHDDFVVMTPSKSALSKLGVGPWAIEDDESESASVVSPEGEVLPGVRWVKPGRDSFSYQLEAFMAQESDDERDE